MRFRIKKTLGSYMINMNDDNLNKTID